MTWSIAGWAAVACLGISILYSAFLHSRAYTAMASQAQMAADEIQRRIARELADRYMWRTIIMQVVKAVIIVILVFFLRR